MGSRTHYKSTIERTKIIKEITMRYYEAGNQQRCYKRVWQKYINPIYPMCYRTYLNYLGITVPPQKKPTALELSLFDYLDRNPY
jgi:hypothetical protein